MAAALDPIRSRLHNVRGGPNGAFTADCPLHPGAYRLSVGLGDDGRALLHCPAGCPTEAILAELGLAWRDLFPPHREGGEGFPARTGAQAHTGGCTLAEYAERKQLPPAFLAEIGVSQITYSEKPALRLLYRDEDGNDLAARFRIALDGPDRFRWRKGSKPTLYGQWCLERARELGWVVLVEVESDVQTLLYHGIPAVGVPGADAFEPTRDAAFFEGIATIYAVREPDQGGANLHARLERSPVKERVRVLDLGGHKDPSALYRAEPSAFRKRLSAAMGTAPRLVDLMDDARRRSRERALERCGDLARNPDILARFGSEIESAGLAGERRAAQLLFLVVVSRLLDRPVSAIVKGPSSAGKSYLVVSVLRFFPPSAYHAMTAMSERALAHSEEPLSHRVLIIYEAAGLSGDFASYLMRSLLSEGRVRYETVEKTKDGMRARLIEREGPTGLILTTTAVRIHPENETRMLSIPTDDTPEQTRAVLRAIAREQATPHDYAPWHALSEYLENGTTGVSVPFAEELAERFGAGHVRLRRDFGTVLALVRTHALLHRATRALDASGRVVATLADYDAVHALLEEIVAQGAEASVPPSVRETVGAVSRRLAERRGADGAAVSVRELAADLGIDRSSASRRAKAAAELGYLRNLEDKNGRPARLILGEPMPDDGRIFPRNEDLCGGAAMRTGSTSPPQHAQIPRPRAGGTASIESCANCRNRLRRSEINLCGACRADLDELASIAMGCEQRRPSAPPLRQSGFALPPGGRGGGLAP